MEEEGGVKDEDMPPLEAAEAGGSRMEEVD